MINALPPPLTPSDPFADLDATRPPFLSVTLVAVLIGLGGVLYDGIGVAWVSSVLAAVGALLAHAGSNVLNHYYNELNGTDSSNTDGEKKQGRSGRVHHGQGRTTPYPRRVWVRMRERLTALLRH